MSTLAEYMIVAGADNRPPMLDKPQYESWKSRMEIYMQGKDHGRMILNLVENGLPPDVYALVNHHKVSKEIWYRVKLLMQGTSLSKQEQECKLYDEFDKFTHVKGETLYTNYLRFVQLINDMKTINMTMQTVQTQYNPSRYQHQFSPPTHHVYSPPPQSNPYGVHLYQQEYPSQSQSTFNHSQPSVTQSAYPQMTMLQQSQAEFPQVELGLSVPTFLPGDDLIACLNKAMTFMSTVFFSRFPLTNNQLRYSSNLRNQDTVQNGKITVQQSARKAICSVNHAQCSLQTDDLDAYDSDCDDILSVAAILMTNLSSCDPETLSEVQYSDYTQNDLLTHSVHMVQYSEQSPNVVYPNVELTSDNNIIPYS
nr:hypothetical protein [Tanacetum cinerariifolium]